MILIKSIEHKGFDESDNFYYSQVYIAIKLFQAVLERSQSINSPYEW